MPSALTTTIVLSGTSEKWHTKQFFPPQFPGRFILKRPSGGLQQPCKWETERGTTIPERNVAARAPLGDNAKT